MRACRSSMDSNTTARPRCENSERLAALGFITAPLGQRLPFNTQIPDTGLAGAASVRMTSRLKHSADAKLAPSGWPQTVMAFTSRLGRSSFMTAGRPPA